ncbi:MAG: enoyl-CoA hydratase/isomerase family protein [Alphaproteobacteria bacterium]|nr:MAG: enoyl-CoA hydratase/isomerase family protein [Alphaproteobacteria bacterium]
MPHSKPVIIQHNSPIGHIVLNRPTALNSLNLEMIQSIHEALDEWSRDPNIVAVLIEGAGTRAFCSGGDIRLMHTKRGDFAFGYEIFRSEYTLNHKIHEYPKPYIAIMNGVTMGGGIGISVYGSHRIVVDSTKFAMPECAIGLFPDIGASWFLQKAPGKIGIYHGLIGTPMNAADALYSGMATHYLTAEELHHFKHKLFSIREAKDVDVLLSGSGRPPMESGLEKMRQQIDDHFSYDSVEKIYRHLGRSEWGKEIKAVMDRNSPTSMALTLEAFRRAAGKSLREVLKTDLLLSQQCLRRDEFYEGVRAAVIDKDRNPKWQPASITEVSEKEVAEFFKPIPGIDLDVFDPQ